MPNYTDPTASAVSSPILNNRPNPGVYVTLLAGFIALGIAGFMWWGTVQAKAEQTQIAAEIAKNDQTLKGLEPIATELLKLDNTAKSLHVLFDGQKEWVGLLEKLEMRLYKKMVITSLSINDQNSLTLTGYVPSYADYAKALSVLSNDPDAKKLFSRVRPGAIVRAEGKVKDQAVAADSSKNITPEGSILFNFNLTLQSAFYAPPTPTPTSTPLAR